MRDLNETYRELGLSPSTENRLEAEDIYHRILDRFTDDGHDQKQLFPMTLPSEQECVRELSMGLELLAYLTEENRQGRSTPVLEFTTDPFCGRILSDIFSMSELTVHDYPNGLKHKFYICAQEVGDEDTRL